MAFLSHKKAELPLISSSQNRRRVSLPSTPPETPRDGYFGPGSRGPAPAITYDSVFPATPPYTPGRALAEEKAPALPPPTSDRRRPSRAHAHHRRTSTAALLRLAAAKQGIILTPSKALALFLLMLSATWLASFLPSPLSFLRPASSSHTTSAPAHPSSPIYVHNNRPAMQPVGEAAERQAWADSFPYRIPPQQHVVPTGKTVEASSLSLDVQIMREHPELLANRARPPRRRPLRLQQADSEDVDGSAISPARPLGEDSSDDASRSPRRPSYDQPGRHAQLNRMKKVAGAKGRHARVGQRVPYDSAQQQAAAQVEQDRIIREGNGEEGRRKLRNPQGAAAAVAAAAEEQAIREASAGWRTHKGALKQTGKGKP
ncbi:hypothetical protein JCM11641_007972 [Rhodosporidiobolus odoratus]